MATKTDNFTTLQSGKRRRRISLASLEDDETLMLIKSVARYAGQTAISEAKVLKLALTYLRGHEVVKCHPDGKIEVIGNVKPVDPNLKFAKGTVLHAKKIR